VVAPSKAKVCGLSLALIAGLNPDGDMVFCLVWTGRSLCDGPIPHPEESNRVLWVCEWYRNVNNMVSWAQAGLLRHSKKKVYKLRISKMIKGNIKPSENLQNTELLYYLRLISCGSLESKLTSMFQLSLPKQKLGRLSFYLQISLFYLIYFPVLVIWKVIYCFHCHHKWQIYTVLVQASTVTNK